MRKLETYLKIISSIFIGFFGSIVLLKISVNNNHYVSYDYHTLTTMLIILAAGVFYYKLDVFSNFEKTVMLPLIGGATIGTLVVGSEKFIELLLLNLYLTPFLVRAITMFSLNSRNKKDYLM